ncbi:MAG TPA: murein L,D-transpeptidase catalytic domain family protein [Longimicrobiaceae bacterium]|nr:murein L,D-transpeptidase catalytic domain family protein [Longimicrobiaceae bacterium]
MRPHPRMLAAAALVLGGYGVLPSVAHAAPLAGPGGPGGVEPVSVAPRAMDVIAAAAPTSAVARAARVESAVGTLAARVARLSHPDALRRAFRAYYNFRAAHPAEVRKPYLYFVDYGLDQFTPRGWVFDMDRMAVVDGPFTVAHGRGSDGGEGVPTRFSNRQGSNATSLGLFLAQETYSFSGSAGGGSYRSIGLRLAGLSGLFNSKARDRGVVVHGAPYVTPQRAGRSEGCPAMEEDRARWLIPMIANGGVVFLFSPLDPNWMAGEPWLQDPAARS